MRYELTDETMEWAVATLHRVRYLETGELGGWIERENNLSQDGTACVLDNAKVYGDASVSGNAHIFGNARVYGDASVSENACVYGDASVSENARVYGDASVSGNARVYGDASVSGNARVYGDAYIHGHAKIHGNAHILGNTCINKYVWDTSPLQIQGTKFYFCVSSKLSITIGCTTKTVNKWLESYEDDFETHGFTEKERNEYKIYFNTAAMLYNWKVPLFEIDKRELD
jgi:hypothetical protein